MEAEYDRSNGEKKMHLFYSRLQGLAPDLHAMRGNRT
jgi:hypothetical protein